MLIFGVLSDRWGRKGGMMTATLIVFVFACLSSGAFGSNGSTIGMLQALSAYRQPCVATLRCATVPCSAA